MSDQLTNPNAMISKLLGELGGDNPQLALMMQLMQSQQSANEDGEDPVTVRQELEVRLAESEARLSEVRAEGHRILAAHKMAIERLGYLAAALGACGLCWGDDSDCPGCRGRGHIGMIRPDNEARERLLGPQRNHRSIVEHPTQQ